MHVQDELDKIGFRAYRHPKRFNNIIICNKYVKYKDIINNIVVEIDEEELSLNNKSANQTLELIKSKIKDYV